MIQDSILGLHFKLPLLDILLLFYVMPHLLFHHLLLVI